MPSHVSRIESTTHPKESLLLRYEQDGHYTDCFRTDISRTVTHSQFVAAFYTTFLFRIERFILKWAVSKPSTDTEAAQLAEGQRDSFAAWDVEARGKDQLLLCDYRAKTRSWLMVEPLSDAKTPRTRLYFGSAVVLGPKDASNSRPKAFGALLALHKLYSIALLRSAKKRLEKTRL